MKFNGNEKTIVIILVTVLIIGAYGFFFLKPQLGGISKIKSEMKFLESDNKDTETLKKQVVNIDSDMKKLKDSIAKIRSKLPDTFQHEELIIDMTEITRDSGVEITSFNFGDPTMLAGGSAQSNNSAQQSSQDVGLTDANLKNAGVELGFINDTIEKKPRRDQYMLIPDGKAFSVDISISATGTYQEMKKFVEVVENKKNINIFKQFALSKSTDELLSIRGVITYYGIKERLKKSYYDKELPTKGEVDLFMPFEELSGYNPLLNKIAKISIENLNKVANFYARLLPFGNGYTPQTLTLIARGIVKEDKIENITIYGDHKFQEKAFINLEVVEGKYYFKMKTSTEGYPDKSFETTAQFDPMSDTLKFLIDSTSRKSSADYAKAKFEITNKTNKRLDVIIINDDPLIPRASIIEKSDNIQVIEQEGGV